MKNEQKKELSIPKTKSSFTHSAQNNVVKYFETNFNFSYLLNALQTVDTEVKDSSHHLKPSFTGNLVRHARIRGSNSASGSKISTKHRAWDPSLTEKGYC